jgi:Protein of unknown function (DUF3383)
VSTVTEVIETTIDIRDAAVSQQGFGTPLIAAAHDFWPERVRTFSELIELVTPPLNVPTDHPIYVNAKALKAQKPSPSQFKVGKRDSLAEQTFELVPTIDPAGTTYKWRIDGVALEYTLAPAGTLAAACTAIAAAIAAAPELADVTATASGTKVTVVGDTDGVRHSFACQTGNLAFTDATLDPGIEDDLNAIYAADQDWYGFAIDSVAAMEILAASSWAETQMTLFFATSMDAACLGAGTTDVLSQLQAASLQRTIFLWHHRGAEQMGCTAWAGKMLPKAPGSANWANMSLALVEMSALSDTERGNLKKKNGNYYVPVKKVGFTLDGRAPGGRFADITHGMDWFETRLDERVVLLFANNDKVPYTDAGIQLVRSQVDAQILAGITATIVDPAQTWWTSAPAVADVDPNDKLQRVLRNVRFQFVLQGAVNKAQINGTVLVAAE